jgi:hypothetical protein
MDVSQVIMVLLAGIAIGMSITNIVWVSTWRARPPAPHPKEPK